MNAFKLLLCLTSLFFLQCRGKCHDGIQFSHKNKHAVMPVVIRGNIASNVLIVFLHGGPGGSGLKKIGTRAFSELENDFAVVYWDQRASGQSKGGKQKKYLTLEQSVEDIDLLIDQLKIQFPASSIFLMGHCWGGGLGTAYLLDKTRQAKISGWIDVAGAHNNPKGDSLSMEWVKQYARNQIASDKEVGYWKNALKWYDKHPDFSSEALGHYLFVRKSHGYLKHEADSLGVYPGYKVKDLAKIPGEYIGYYLNYYQTLSKYIVSEYDFTDAMKEIEIPALVIWGRNDGLIPVTMGYEAFDALGTPCEEKQLVVFENTAHTVFYEQPVEFTKAVKSFINTFAPRKQSPVVRNNVNF